MRECYKKKGNFIWIAFGVGCIISLCLPAVWVTRILAGVIIILGIMVVKS